MVEDHFMAFENEIQPANIRRFLEPKSQHWSKTRSETLLEGWRSMSNRYLGLNRWVLAGELTPRLNGEHLMINLNGKLGTPNLGNSFLKIWLHEVVFGVLSSSALKMGEERRWSPGLGFVGNYPHGWWSELTWLDWIWSGKICLTLSWWIWSCQCLDLNLNPQILRSGTAQSMTARHSAATSQVWEQSS